MLIMYQTLKGGLGVGPTIGFLRKGELLVLAFSFEIETYVRYILDRIWNHNHKAKVRIGREYVCFDF